VNASRALPALGLLVASCAVYVPPPFTGEPTPLRPPEEAWARVLRAAVDGQGRVDFNAVLQTHKDLDRYIAWVYERSPVNWADLYPTRAHVIAYHLNAYNALALYNLLHAGVPTALGPLERRTFFEKREMFVGGQHLSLQAYKDEVIRALGEPRVHFALTSLMAGDPRLSRDPYRFNVLDQQLDRAARNFFAEERNLRIDDARRRIRLSPILQTYAADFLRHAPSLVAYAGEFHDALLPQDYAVEFGEFDWTLYGTRPAGTPPR